MWNNFPMPKILYSAGKVYISCFLLGCVVTYYSSTKIIGKQSNDLMLHLSELKSETSLNIPFYVYEDLVWDNTTITYHNKSTKVSFGTFMNHKYVDEYAKHSDDYLFLQHALNHPMRVKDPKEAKLFYVPALMNLIALFSLNEYLNGKYCVEGKCNEELFEVINEALGNSWWFQRHKGADHIIVASHYGYNAKWQVSSFENDKSSDFARNLSKKYRNIFNCNKVVFENVAQSQVLNLGRVNIPSMYVGHKCGTTDLQQHEKYRFVFLREVHRLEVDKKSEALHLRVNICEWLKDQNANDLCGEGVPMCPNIKFAKFGFHVEGDTFGSSRPMDLIMNGVVPVFTSHQQYDILPQWIPWRELSYFVDVSSKENFLTSVQQIADDERGYRLKHEAIMSFREMFDHRNRFLFDMYMQHFAESIQ